MLPTKVRFKPFKMDLIIFKKAYPQIKFHFDRGIVHCKIEHIKDNIINAYDTPLDRMKII